MIKKFLKWDKFQHCLGSLLLTLILWYFIGWWTVLLVFLIGLGKEIKDYFTEGSYCEWKDMLANIIGITVAVLIVSLI